MRTFIGIILVLHGLAHAGAGMWAAGPVWLITILWWLATGLYVLGVRNYARWTPELIFAALVPSSLLLGQFAGWFVLPGIALDVILILVVVRLRNSDALSERSPRAQGRFVQLMAVGFLVYTSGAILARPWAMHWGTTAGDRRAPMFGDSLHPAATFHVDNAITIAAPAD